MEWGNTLPKIGSVVIFSILFVFFRSPISEAKELKIAFGQNRPPFVFQEDGKLKGFEEDIVREALKYKGHAIKKKTQMPNKRLEFAVARSGYDGAAAVQKLDDGTYYSDNFVTYINYAISRKRDKVRINSIRDLTHYYVVAWQNAYRNLGPEFSIYYGPDAQGDHLKSYKEFANQKYQNAFFWKGRANVIIVDKTIFLWYRKQLSGPYDTSGELVFHNIFPKKTYYQVNFKDKGIRDDFNEGLKYLRKTGKYQQIIDAYK
jgi:polar amino acid transport system substrate-binding protein